MFETDTNQIISICLRVRLLTNHILSSTNIIDYGPKLIHQPQSVMVKPNTPHTIECPVESQPTAEVKWFKDDQLLVSQAPRLEQMGSELVFIQMVDDDTGDYHCEATNYLGTITSDHFRLTVQSSKYFVIVVIEVIKFNEFLLRYRRSEIGCSIFLGS